MHYLIVTFLLYLIFLQRIFSENLNGIFLIDSCKCNSSKKETTCEPKGPFILNQNQSKLSIKYGSTQIGVGTLGNNQIDLYLNQNHCKGFWNSTNHLAELKCQHQNEIICTTNLRCILGSCLNDTTIIISSASIISTISFLFMIFVFIMLV